MLDKFKIKKVDDTFIVESKISGNKLTVDLGYGASDTNVLLWTILNDLFEDGDLSNISE